MTATTDRIPKSSRDAEKHRRALGALSARASTLRSMAPTPIVTLTLLASSSARSSSWHAASSCSFTDCSSSFACFRVWAFAFHSSSRLSASLSARKWSSAWPETCSSSSHAKRKFCGRFTTCPSIALSRSPPSFLRCFFPLRPDDDDDIAHTATGFFRLPCGLHDVRHVRT